MANLKIRYVTHSYNKVTHRKSAHLSVGVLPKQIGNSTRPGLVNQPTRDEQRNVLIPMVKNPLSHFREHIFDVLL